VAAVPSFTLAEASHEGRATAGGAGEETVVLCGAFVFHEADHPALAALPHLIRVPGEAGRPPAWLAGYIDAISAEAFGSGPGSEMVMARLSDALVARALRFHLAEADEPGWLRALADPRLARALALIHDRPGEDWTVAALARACGLSRAAFAARFSREAGEPPMQYLLRHRMRRAMGLLRRDGATLARVADAVGYGSEAAFSAAFKRHAGMAPGAYRRSQRGAGP
jgi:AraC-like DNA-binding protein